jgi:hypothetical protein
LQEGYRRATPILMQSGMKKGLFGRGTMLDQRSAACGVARITMGTTILARKYAVGVMAALFFLSLAWSARAEPVTLACRDLISAPYRMQLDLAAAVVRDLDVDSQGIWCVPQCVIFQVADGLISYENNGYKFRLEQRTGKKLYLPKNDRSGNGWGAIGYCRRIDGLPLP